MLLVVAGISRGHSLRLLCLMAALFLCASLTSTNSALGQDTSGSQTPNANTLATPEGPRTLVVGPRTPINPPGVGYHGEVMAAADPESADNLIVCGYRVNQKRGSAYEGYVYQSDDSGETWHEALVDLNSQWVSEESCAFGPSHQAYFVSGVSDTSQGEPHHEFGNMYLYRSSNSGRTWQTVQVGRFMDYTSMTVDSTAGPQRNTLYIFANNLADGEGSWFGTRPTDPSSDKRPFLAVRRELPEPSFSVTSGNFNSGDEGVKSRAKYPLGSAVLSDGTVLAVFIGDKEVPTDDPGKKTHVFYVAVGISNDGGKTLRKNVVYQDAVPSVVSALAVNQSTDQIYVCWTPRYGMSAESKLMLATSKDKGRTWNVKAVDGPPDTTLDVRAGSVSLATNKAGVLGFMWYGTHVGRVYFGTSFDEGRSVSNVVPLTSDEPSDLPHNTPRVDDRRLMVFPPSWNISSRQLEPLHILGMNRFGVSVGNALVADSNGAFHPVWSELTNGPTHLWTRTISVQVGTKSAPVLTPVGLTDISDRIVWHISNVRYDHLASLVSFDVVVTNKAPVVVKGPILAVVSSPTSQLGLAVENADNKKPGDGALWELRILSGGLQCEQSTEPRTLTFRINMENEDGPREDIPLRIYGKLP